MFINLEGLESSLDFCIFESMETEVSVILSVLEKLKDFQDYPHIALACLAPC